MKFILSRKGFDSGYGGCASPILPDGTMLSIPIPVKEDSGLKFCELTYQGISYIEILKMLNPKMYETYKYCHLDPDIRQNIRKVDSRWKAAFGQIGCSETHLEHQGVGIGDVFLFFGWFKETEFNNGILQYKENALDKQVLFGYLQVGEIYKGNSVKKFDWHPHSNQLFLNKANNTIYVASDVFTLDRTLPGYGTFKYNKDLILTKDGESRSKWKLPEFFKETHISYHSENSFKNGYFQSAKKGQEFVISEHEKVSNWAYSIIKNNIE